MILEAPEKREFAWSKPNCLATRWGLYATRGCFMLKFYPMNSATQPTSDLRQTIYGQKVPVKVRAPFLELNENQFQSVLPSI